MNRRDFITLLGGAAAAWPLAARAQQAGTPVIGLLWPGDAPPVSPRMESFRQGLRAAGFVDGQNVAIELRYAQKGPQQLPELAAELVRSKVDVIFTGGDLAGVQPSRRRGRSPLSPSATTSSARALLRASRGPAATLPGSPSLPRSSAPKGSSCCAT